MATTKTITRFNESRYAAWLVAIGDSQTDFGAGFGVRPSYTWLPQTVRLLRRRGANVRGRAFGVSGDTSAQTLARADVLFLKETPDVGLIHIGVNDPSNSINQAGTQANIQALIKILKHGAVGIGGGLNGTITVTNPSNLPAGCKQGQRVVVLADNDTTGGVSPWASTAAARIGGSVAGGGQAVWECDYPLPGVFGWHRVAVDATAPTKCSKIVVVSTNYLNFTGTSGDTPSTPYASYATVRAAQEAAVTAENVAVGGNPSVIYADVYGFQRARILAGTDLNFSSDTSLVASSGYDQNRSWHYTSGNQHKSAYGHLLDAQVVDAAIVAAGWMPSFKQLAGPV